MEQDDEEFEKLLGEIPRATSAPPHLEELQRASSVQLHESSFLNGKDEAMKPVTESRADEFYQGFYRPFPGARKSLETIENGVFNDPPMLSPKSASDQLSSFYSGLALDNSRTSYQLRQLGLQQKQEAQMLSPHSSHGQLQHSSTSGLVDHLSQPQSEQQMLHNDQGLPSAFAKLNFEESSIVEAGVQSRAEKGKSNGSLEHVMSTSLTNDSCSGASSGLYSHGIAMGATSPGFGSASEESLESRLPRSLPSLDVFSQNASSIRVPMGNGLPNGFDELPMAAAGHVLEKRPLQRAPGLDPPSNGRSSLEIAEAGYLPTNPHPQQQQQQSVAAYTDAVAAMAAAAMQAGCQYPNVNANGMFAPSVGQQVHYPLDTDMASFVQAQRMQEAAIVRAQQQMEERVWYRQRMQQEFLLRQQQLQEQQARFYASLQGQPGAPGSTYSRVHPGNQPGHQPPLNSSLAFNLVPQQQSPKATLTGSMAFDGGWKQQQSQGAWAAPMVVPEAGRSSSHVGNVCRYFAQGFCCRGVTCPFFHFQPQGGNTNHVSANAGGNPSSHDPTFSEKMSPRKSPRNGQVIPGVSIILSGSRKKDCLANGHSNGHLLSNGNHLSALNRLDSVNGDSKASSGAAPRRSLDLETLRSLNMQHHLPQQQQQQPKYTTLQEVEGRIYTIAKDQHGCRFLQRKFEEGATDDVQNIFMEIIDHIVELMTDPFGNYLVQKLLEVCSETQRMEILCRVTGKGQLVTISLNMHGTRAVQKLIETLKSSEQVAMVISSLRQGVVSLIKDLNGNHVVQRCLQRLSNEDSQFIFDAAVAHCVEIATHRHGCCVLQRCVDFASGHQQQQLVAEIAANALVLSQDPFGNYVVQYILDLGISRATVEVITRLEGNYAHLAMQKFSSNVVEKCLKLAGEENKAQIIQELLSSSRLGQLLQDPYANYVVQSALTVSKGSLHTGLVEAIRPHLPALRSSPYGKRILSRTNLKK